MVTRLIKRGLCLFRFGLRNSHFGEVVAGARLFCLLLMAAHVGQRAGLLEQEFPRLEPGQQAFRRHTVTDAHRDVGNEAVKRRGHESDLIASQDERRADAIGQAATHQEQQRS